MGTHGVGGYRNQPQVRGKLKGLALFEGNRFCQALVTLVHAPCRWVIRLLTGHLVLGRGMALWYDMHDWLAGVPFEVAAPQTVIAFLRDKDFCS